MRKSYLTVIVIAALFLFLPRQAQAQEWLTVMLEQMAKFEAQLQELKQGYDIVQKGLTTISQIKQGDFDLHSLFFTSLKTVSPGVKAYVKIADMLAMETQMLSGIKQVMSQIAGSGIYSASEVAYLSAVFSNLSTLIGKDIAELTGITTDGDFQMTDDERLARIDKLYKEATDKYDFYRTFSSEVRLAGQQRLSEKNSLQTISKFYQP